jgi:thiosulfate dehydrogenase
MALSAPLYRKVCADCHNSNGSGISNGTANSALGYLVPALWGKDTFNDGAGMARLITFANFIHFNMPHGTDYVDPQLSVESAWTSPPLSCRIGGRIWPASNTISLSC